MSTILFSVGFFLLMALAMSIGVLAGRKPIKGSCGGMSAMIGADCPVCGGDGSKCDSSDAAPREPAVKPLYHDAGGAVPR